MVPANAGREVLTVSSAVLRIDEPAVRLESRVRRLVAQIHAEVADCVYSPAPASVSSVTELLNAAPAGLCRELMDVYHTARATGIGKERLTARLSASDKLLFDLVLAMYDSSLHPALPQKSR
jgi:hypothetical protein